MNGHIDAGAARHRPPYPRVPFNGTPLGYGLLVLVLFTLLAWPLIMLAIGAFRSVSPLQTGGTWTTVAFARMWDEINTSHALANSIFYAVATTGLGVAVATVLAFFAERIDTPFRRLITPLVMVCATTSTVFYAIGYSLLANAHNGVVNVFYFYLTGERQPLVNIESWSGLIFVDSLHLAAFLYLFLIGPFRAFDRAHEEAALAAGASRLRALWTINARLLTPILTSVVLIGLVLGLKSFNIPLILGGHADLSFVTVRILRVLQNFTPPRYADASALALGLTAVVVLLVIAQYWIVGRRAYVTVTGKSYRQGLWDIGRWRWLAAGFVGVYCLFAVILPLGAIVISSFLPFPGVYKTLTLHNYTAMLANPDMWDVVGTTIFVAGVGGLLGVLFAFALAYATERAHPAMAAFLRGSTLLPLAMPGIVGSLALIWAVVSVPFVRQLYGSLWLLMIALIIAVLTVCVQIASGSVRQIARELEDAARVAGASTLRVVVDITGPLVLPSLLFAWFIAAIMIVGDLDAPLMLSSASTLTVSIHTYKLFEGAQESQAAALLTVILASILILAGVQTVLRRLIAGRTTVLRTSGSAKAAASAGTMAIAGSAGETR